MSRESKIEIRNLVRMLEDYVNALETLDPHSFVGYGGAPSAQTMVSRESRVEGSKELTTDVKTSAPLTLQDDANILSKINLVVLAAFINRVAGKSNSQKILTTYRNLGFIKKETCERLLTVLEILPDMVGVGEPDDRMEDLILALIDLYEQRPGYWAFLLLVRLIERLLGGDVTVELK
jgi:hypothetical protein